MEKSIIEKYLGRKVFVILKNHFKYNFYLNPENIKGDTLSIVDKFGVSVDILISDIALIKEAERGKRK